MSDINQLAESVIRKVQRKQSRAALDGIIGLLYATHSAGEVTAMLADAHEQAREFG